MILRPTPESTSGQGAANFLLRNVMVLVPVLLVLTMVSSVDGQLNVTKGSSGSSSRADRNQAVAAIPFNDLNDEAKRKLRGVVSSPSFYRKLPTARIDADPEHIRFLVRKPEVVVAIWRLMGVTQLDAVRKGPYTIETDDGAGTQSQMELIYGNNDLHVYYGSGSYAGNLLKRKLTGRFVVVVQTQSQPAANGTFDLVAQLDVFVKVDNVTAAFITRTVQPIVGSTADYNFVESMKFIERLNRTARTNGPGVIDMNARLKIDSGTRQSYNRVIEAISTRSLQTVSARQVGKLPASRQSTVQSNSLARTQIAPVPTPGNRVTSRAPLKASASSSPRIVTQPAANSVYERRQPTRPAGTAPQSGLSNTRSQSFSVLVGGPRESMIRSNSGTMNSVAAASAKPQSKTGVRARFYSPNSRPTAVNFSDSQAAVASPAMQSVRRR